MDSELFTVGGRLNATFDTTDSWREKTADAPQVNYQWVKTLQTYRHVGKVLWVMLIILVIYALVVMWPLAINVYKSLVTKSAFTQKEGLQYLGASTNVTRDDTGWPTHDTLAEMALSHQTQAPTASAPAPAPTPAKATFVIPRERQTDRKLTPEEELIKKQKANH